MRKAILCILSAIFLALTMSAQAQDWNGKQAAVVLTYDDALAEHINNALPDLNKNKLKGTFYVTAYFDGFKSDISAWKQLSESGHELANHTLVHPCIGNKPGREWVNKERDLSQWSVKRMVDEIAVTNVLLEAVDGKKQRTFAYPCGDKTAMGKDYVEAIEPMFVAARAVGGPMQKPSEVELFNINSVMINGETADEMIKMVDEAISEGKLLVFLFHGVGGGHPLDVKREDHQQLLSYLHKKRKQLWVPTVIELAQFIKKQ